MTHEGAPTDALYVIVSGRARVFKRSERGEDIALNTLTPGDSFGELEILQRAPAPATVRATSDVLALRLDGKTFESILETHPDIRTYLELQLKHRRLQTFFQDFPAFARLPPQAVVSVILAELEPVLLEAGQVLFRQGDPPGALYLLDEGRIRVRTAVPEEAETVANLGPGQYFGEVSAYKQTPRTSTAEAVTRCRLLALSDESFRHLIETVPEFRAQVEARISRFEFREHANVPSDFDEELLPAGAGAQPTVGPEQVSSAPADGEAAEETFPPRTRRARSVPFVAQIDATDAGPAALGMVCRHFGRKVSLARIRQLVNTGVDGVSLRSICHAASELGLAARSLKLTPAHLETMPLPAIAHWGGDHWVVVYDADATSVRVMDPALGRRRMSREEFVRRWTGYVALFDYTSAFDQAPLAPGAGWLLPIVRPYRAIIVKALWLAVIVSALTMALPIFTQVAVDRVVVEHDVALLNLMMIGMGATVAFLLVSMLVQRYLLSFAAVRIDAASLDFLTQRLLALPLSYFSSRRTGDIQRRLDGLRQVREFVVREGINGVTAIAQLVASLTLMFIYSPTLALVFLATSPLYGILMFASYRWLRPTLNELEDAFSRYKSYQIDAIKGIESVKALGGESTFRELMLQQFLAVAGKQFSADFTVMSYAAAVDAVKFLTMALCLMAGAHQVMNGHLTIGGLVAFNSLVAMSTSPLRSLLDMWDRIQYGTVLLNRLNDLLEHEPEQGHDRSHLRPVRRLDGAISFRNLGFRYGGPESPAILDGITLDVPAGSTVAIVGRSGSGKTTLAKCLAGLLEPTEGTILYDGLDMKGLNYRDLRKQIGYVLQENHLFSDTIARNIAFGEDEPDLDRVAWAAETASARDFIERLPHGYETRVGESGLALSGGQRQRVAIARCVYAKPPVLIFDEATSALDTESERAVKDNMDVLVKGRTAFIIAHRLSTVQNANLIVVLERGRLVEHGTHDELLKRQGLYYYLSSQQLAMVG